MTPPTFANASCEKDVSTVRGSAHFSDRHSENNMPHPRACFLLILLLCQFTGPVISGVLKELVGDLGGSVTFPLKAPGVQIDSLVWIFNTTPLITIQPKTPESQTNAIVTQSHNKERVDYVRGNYSLKLGKLDKSDSGDYRVVIYSSSLKDPFTQQYRLRVYGEQNQF